MSQVDEWLNSARGGLSEERLSEVFDLVKPQYPHPWKGPIEAEVAKEKATQHEIETAVAWYAGGHPTVVDHGPHWYVTGAGYYEWIGA